MNHIVESRRENIESLLVANNTMKVADLALQLHVTPETIRKDLDYLERKGFLKRSHGSCTLVENSSTETPLKFRMQENSVFKKNVSEAIFPYIKDGMLLFIGSSSNTMPLAGMLKVKKGLTIYTNSLDAAERVVGGSNKVILLGGDYHSISRSTSGETTINMIEGVYFDLGIFGVDGCKDMEGPGSFHHEEAAMVQRIVNHSRFSILPFESKKFEMTARYQWAKFSDFDLIITGSLSKQNKDKLGNVKTINVSENEDIVS